MTDGVSAAGASVEELSALHRYFLSASTLRRAYEQRGRTHGFARISEDDWTQQWLFLSLWYATLYVTVEGWLELKLSEPRVDVLLADETMVESLRRFRNGVLHYQHQYHHEKLVNFIAQGTTSAEWVRSLHDCLGEAILARLSVVRETDSE